MLHVDRIATAWAIGRFVDADASFVFVPRTKDVRGMAEIPFDIRGARLSHRGERCTFEVLVETHRLTDAALGRMGLIVRGADLPHEDGMPAESPGVRAVFDALWGTDFVIESNVVDRHVRALRAKLQNDWHKPRYIETVPGSGYRFVPGTGTKANGPV